MSSVRRSLLVVGVPVLLVLGAMIWWLSQPKAKSQASIVQVAAVRVHVQPVRVQDVAIRLPGLGIVQAWHSATIRARIDGQLQSLGFREGEQVKKGQLIAQLDNRAQKAQLDLALAQRSRDQAQLDNARQDLKRYTELARQSAINRQTLDTQRAQVATLQAIVQADDAQVQAARVQLDYTRIVAPFAGRTGARLVDPGNLVRAADGQGLVVINQTDPIAINFTVPDTEYAQIQAALKGADALDAAQPAIKVQVLPRGQSGVLKEGHLVLVDNQVDTSSGTLRLKARFDNPDAVLWPGQAVDVRLVLGVRKHALTVPDAAVQRGAQGLFVYVVSADNTVRAQAVQVAFSQDGFSVIEQGLAAEDRVVTDGQYRLHPGARIAEIQPESADHKPAASQATAPAAS
ncbi:efflux RND transporter periplasmic adaptor subunit [Castellaniella sp.]|uniref:efflux RND transporter periplasmic adaptor subunit n=1 Tax=Castellaniella sp. TaxID=1955812 RepID=UPI003C778785